MDFGDVPSLILWADGAPVAVRSKQREWLSKIRLFLLGLGCPCSLVLGKALQKVGGQGNDKCWGFFALSVASLFCWQKEVVSEGIYLLFWVSSPPHRWASQDSRICILPAANHFPHVTSPPSLNSTGDPELEWTQPLKGFIQRGDVIHRTTLICIRSLGAP